MKFHEKDGVNRGNSSEFAIKERGFWFVGIIVILLEL